MKLSEFMTTLPTGTEPLMVTDPELVGLLFGLSTAYKQNSAGNLVKEALTGAAMGGLARPAAANTSMPFADTSQVAADIQRQLSKAKHLPLTLTMTANHLPVGTHFTHDLDGLRALLALAPGYRFTLVSPETIEIQKQVG